MTSKCFVITSLFLLILSACTSIECPVQNTVYTVYTLADTLHDTLTVSTVRADGIDSVLLNRSVNPTRLTLPISYQRSVDTLVFSYKRLLTADTIWVSKQDIPHFESVDCSASFFHHVTSVRSTHSVIDTIVITNPTVNYDPSSPHFRITFKDHS